MRRLPIALIAAFAAFAAGLAVLAATPAGGQEGGGRRHVDVIEVIGLLDPVLVDFIGDAVRAAEAGGAEAVVIQLDSGGAVADPHDVDVLAFRVAHARVPVAVWVGPSGSRAVGPAFQLVRAAAVAGVAPRTRVGPAGAVLGAAEALERGEVEVSAPTFGDFLVELDGRQVGGATLETAEVVRRPGEDPRRRPTVEVRFAKLGLVPRLLHTAASPSVAYLLFVAGLVLIVLELYTAGIGAAAATGAACIVLSCYGLAVLPTRPYAVALLVLGVVGYAIDVQAGTPRTWTVIGTVAMAVGTVRLYEGGLAPSPVVMLTVVAGTALLMVAGLPAMVRSRFSTPTIGRESMVGELGAALAAVDPEGTVEVRGAPWPARTNRATPIEAGESVRVVAIDGLLLEVEPLEGGAKDYRKH